MTFRVEEEKEEEEEIQATPEAPTNPRIGEGGGVDMMKNMQNGMLHNHQEQGQRILMVSGGQTMEVIVRGQTMEVIVIATPKKNPRIGITMDIPPKSMRIEKMKKERGPGAPVQEEIGLVDGTEIQTGREKEEITQRTEEITEVDITQEEEVLIGKTEDHTAQTDMKGEIIAQGSGMKDRTTDQELQEGIIHLKKAGGTLITDEGDAKRPLVTEGLLQANQ